jgi:hypothetical protein
MLSLSLFLVVLLVLLLLCRPVTAGWCSVGTGCGVGRCTCALWISTCVTQDDANGVCTLTQAGIWFFVGLALLAAVVILLVCLCICCCCCCRKQKKTKEVYFMPTPSNAAL